MARVGIEVVIATYEIQPFALLRGPINTQRHGVRFEPRQLAPVTENDTWYPSFADLHPAGVPLDFGESIWAVWFEVPGCTGGSVGTNTPSYPLITGYLIPDQ